MCLCCLHIGSDLIRFIVELNTTFFFCKESKIKISIRYPIIAITREYIFSFLQCFYDMFGQLDPTIFTCRIACISNLNTVDVQNSVIVMCKFDIYGFARKILSQFNFPSNPNFRFLPISLHIGFFVLGTEWRCPHFPLPCIK